MEKIINVIYFSLTKISITSKKVVKIEVIIKKKILSRQLKVLKNEL